MIQHTMILFGRSTQPSGRVEVTDKTLRSKVTSRAASKYKRVVTLGGRSR